VIVGFDVFMIALGDGATRGLPRAEVRAAFGPWLREGSPDLWQVEYDGPNSCAIYIDENPDRIVSAMISRPCADERLWDSLFKILLLGNAMLMWPGCKAPVIAREDTIPFLPESVAEMGLPRCVKSGREISQLIRAG
jgi:hypothetical protein